MPSDGRTVGLDEAGDLGGRFIDEFDAKMPDAGVAQGGEQGTGRLRRGVEHRVAATDVGLHQVVAALWVAEVDAMPLARPAAIAVAVAVRKEAGEHAILGVKYRQMLMRDHLDAGALAGRQRTRQGRELLRIEIMGGRKALQALCEQHARRQYIRAVQGEVAVQGRDGVAVAQRRAGPAKVLQRPQRPAERTSRASGRRRHR